jgi:phage/plasmid-associated DNA primase
MREFETRSDRVALWVSEKCTVHADAAGRLVGPDQGTKKTTLHEMFKAWAKDEDTSGSMSARKFVERLRSVNGVGEVRLRHEGKNIGLNVTPGVEPTPAESTPHSEAVSVSSGNGTDENGMGGVKSVGRVANGTPYPYVRESKVNDHEEEGHSARGMGLVGSLATLPTPPTPEPTPAPMSPSVTDGEFSFELD